MMNLLQFEMIHLQFIFYLGSNVFWHAGHSENEFIQNFILDFSIQTLLEFHFR